MPVPTSSFLSSGTSRQRHADPYYVAVKILSTHATEVQGRLVNELVEAYPGRKHIATLLDNFTITDRHGSHLCLVFEALGAFNGSVYHPGQNLPVLFVKDIARQLLVALDFLHRECQIVHTGKIVAHIISLLQLLLLQKTSNQPIFSSRFRMRKIFNGTQLR